MLKSIFTPTKSTITVLFSFVIPAVIMLLSTPYLLNEWTDNRFAIYTLGLSVLGFMNVFDLGLGRSLTQFIAKHKAQLSTEGWVLNHVLYIGVLMGLLGTGLIFLGFSSTQKFLVQNPIKNEQTLWPLWLSLQCPLIVTSSIIRGWIEAQEKFLFSTIIKSINGSLIFLVPLMCLLQSIQSLATVFSLIFYLRLSVLSIALMVLFRQYEIQKSPHQGPFGVLKKTELFKTGWWMTVSYIFGQAITLLDRFILVLLLGGVLIGPYIALQELSLRFIMIPLAISTVYLPRWSGDFNKSKQDFKSSHIWIITPLLVVWVLWFFNGRYLISSWLDLTSNTEELYSLSKWLLMGVTSSSFAFLPLTHLQASGFSKVVGRLHLTECLVYACLLYWIVPSFGLEGAAILWAIRAVLDCLFLYGFKHRLIK